MCVCSGTGCVYFVRGVRQISWCITGAIKVVALVTAHEQRNDVGLRLISPCLAPSLSCWPALAAGQGSGLTGKQRRLKEKRSVPALRPQAEAGKQAREGEREKKCICDQNCAVFPSKKKSFTIVFRLLVICPTVIHQKMHLNKKTRRRIHAKRR